MRAVVAGIVSAGASTLIASLVHRVAFGLDLGRRLQLTPDQAATNEYAAKAVEAANLTFAFSILLGFALATLVTVSLRTSSVAESIPWIVAAVVAPLFAMPPYLLAVSYICYAFGVDPVDQDPRAPWIYWGLALCAGAAIVIAHVLSRRVLAKQGIGA